MASTSILALQNRLLSHARFRHMQVMVALAELGSVRRAADSIGMSQPAVSKVLADLETLLGLQLFQRHAKGVHATRECLDLLVLARQTVNGAATAAAAVVARSKRGEGTVRVSATAAAVNGVLVPAIRSFNDAFPGVQVQLAEAPIDDVLLAAARGDADIVLCRKPAMPPEGWRFDGLVADEFAVVCSPRHPLASKRRVSVAELFGERWLPGHAAAASRRHLELLAQDAGQELKVCELMTVLSTVNWWLLRDSRLLMLAPVSVFRPFLEAGELATLRYEKKLPFDTLGVLRPVRDLEPAAQRLVAHLASVHPGER